MNMFELNGINIILDNLHLKCVALIDPSLHVRSVFHYDRKHFKC